MARNNDRPNAPETLSGIEYTLGYEELPATGEMFEGKTVAIIGLGNAGMETADSITPYANYVHMYAARRSLGKGLGTDQKNFVSV